eukprot:TRINITY_DN2461_c0_g2_i1.p2 TRINITY_DN2461_c0_g2~~TRINITY_DN2461_c0_g2_i1.p2  ORF type:complete len:119 (+),score=51.49 TRINITY_DN2461_c0_g2_i1:96-452(+)
MADEQGNEGEVHEMCGSQLTDEELHIVFCGSERDCSPCICLCCDACCGLKPQAASDFLCNCEKGTCLCEITPGDWAVILTLFAFYYCCLGLFFWGMIEAMFVVKQQGYPVHAHATDPQ